MHTIHLASIYLYFSLFRSTLFVVLPIDVILGPLFRSLNTSKKEKLLEAAPVGISISYLRTKY
jgi:hypothetical protein